MHEKFGFSIKGQHNRTLVNNRPLKKSDFRYTLPSLRLYRWSITLCFLQFEGAMPRLCNPFLTNCCSSCDRCERLGTPPPPISRYSLLYLLRVQVTEWQPTVGNIFHMGQGLRHEYSCLTFYFLQSWGKVKSLKLGNSWSWILSALFCNGQTRKLL